MSSEKAGWISFDGPGGTIRAFFAQPRATAPLPALIMIHPVTGLTEHIQSEVRRYAGEGYLTVAPDIYSHDATFPTLRIDDIDAAAHMGRDPEHWEPHLAPLSSDQRDAVRNARSWIDDRPTSSYGSLVRACYDYLADRKDVAAIGCMGYCMGGRLTGELAAQGVNLAAGVIYFGGHPGLDKVASIRCPLEGHYGVTDTGITPKVYPFAVAMHEAGKTFNYSVYNAGHGFTGHPTSPAFDVEAAEVSDHRTRLFLARHLKSAVDAR